ncbi:MAG TPA: FHA domain-containing protein [Thermoleophilaceae bacterium]|nr:FHA domain-containing protein [Thermoleophilaceae bacterium]
MERNRSRTQAFRAGTLAGAGSFRCDVCSFAVALHELDELPACPHCGSGRFKRSSIFGERAPAEPWGGGRPERPDWLEEVREALVADGDYLAYEDDHVRVVPLQEGWTRVGRSIAAHLHFDDPTVSRRHALLHRDEEGVRVLDDRSLNGVFVNGDRVEWQALEDGDEVLIGRFRLYLVTQDLGATERSAERAGSTVG